MHAFCVGNTCIACIESTVLAGGDGAHSSGQQRMRQQTVQPGSSPAAARQHLVAHTLTGAPPSRRAVMCRVLPSVIPHALRLCSSCSSLPLWASSCSAAGGQPRSCSSSRCCCFLATRETQQWSIACMHQPHASVIEWDKCAKCAMMLHHMSVQ